MLVVNGLLAIGLTAIYVFLLIIIFPILRISGSTITHALATISIAVAVLPLRQRIVVLSNRLLDRDWLDQQSLIHEFSHALGRTIEPEAIRALLVDDLPSRLNISRATLWLLEPPEDRILAALGVPPDQTGTAFLVNGVSATRLRHVRTYLLVDFFAEQAWAQPFLENDIHLLFPLRVGNQMIGMYGLGAPINQRSYAPAAISVLLMLAPTAASALENVRAYVKIERLNAQLQSFDNLKDIFIESVGHELRTPLTSLSLATQLIATNPSLANELIGMLHTNVNRLQGLIDRILSMDPSTLPTQQTIAEVELIPLLSNVVEVFLPAAKASGIQLFIHAPPDIAVWAEANRLRRAVHEIVDNAVRYGGGGAVVLAASMHDGLAFISVSDQGAGIPEDEQPLLFRSFYRGRKNRAMAATPGVGLGLSIAQREVEAFGGRVWLERAGSEGSTVSLALPAVVRKIADPPERERAVGADL
jgi:signal transduction histidine kinase